MIQVNERVDHAAVYTNLEVQVVAGGIAGGTDICDFLALFHSLTNRYGY